MRFVFIHAEKALYPVRVLCSVLGVSRSGYYAWIARPRAARAQADEQLVVEIVAAHRRSRATYGSPRVHSELRTRGTRVGRKRIERLMRERGIRARRKRRFRRTTDSRHAYPIAPNVLGRRFAVKSANAVWVTDVTSIWTGEGWTFLAVMLDLFARRVVGWAASETNDTALALAVLDSALRERSPAPGLLHHSDRGSPYASRDYQGVLAARGIVDRRAVSAPRMQEWPVQVPRPRDHLSRDQVEVLELADAPRVLAELMVPSGRSDRTRFRDQIIAPLGHRGGRKSDDARLLSARVSGAPPQASRAAPRPHRWGSRPRR